MARPPLAERLRPRTLDEVVGQQALTRADGWLRRALADGQVPSMVLCGPPGCGKTTLARLVAAEAGADFVPLSAVLDGVKALRAVVDGLTGGPTLMARDTVVFVDEIHRWNKAQQDALLPHVESGALVLLGATTENPSFSLNPALRSRVRVVPLEPLSTDDVRGLLERALSHPDGLADAGVSVDPDVLARLAEGSAGDARRGLRDLEALVGAAPPGGRVDEALLEATLDRADLRHDRSGSDHYDVVSAWIKSMRGSDPDAAIYWLARLIAGGEPPRFIARRLVIFASEDVGNADPRALALAVDALRVVEHVGMPEARIALAQAATFCAAAPKSNAAYAAIDAALAEVERTGALPVPLPLRQAPVTTLHREDPARAYAYPHDHPFGVVRQQYLPDRLVGRRYYEPKPYGEEKTIGQRLAFWARQLDRREGGGS